MPGSRARGALIGVAGLGLLVGLPLGARALVLQAAGGVLSDAGCTWGGTQHELTRGAWREVDCEGATVELVEVEGTSRGVVLSGVEVDLEHLAPRLMERLGDSQGAGQGSGGSKSWLWPRRVEVQGLDLSFGQLEVASELEGSLWPTLDLSGPGGLLTTTDEGLRVEVDRPVELGPLSGSARMVAESAAQDAVPGIRLTVESEAWTLDHPLLGDRALGPFAGRVGPLFVDLEGRRAHGEGEVLGLPLQLSFTEGKGVELVTVGLSVTETPLSAVFGQPAIQALVPEARGATLGGSVGFEGALSGPPWRVTGKPVFTELSAEGVIPQVATLRRGGITWKTQDAAGNITVRRADSQGSRWVRPSDAMVVAQAFMAAEDRRFLDHQGIDDYALSEALEAMAADLAAGEEVRVRGASTLSQQLAKNLFLDGERSLRRKLRELLYALELERALGKDRILELYLNVVELGPDIYGVGAAADAYFLKRPAALNAKEAAFLAVLLPSPRRGHADWYLRERVPETKISTVLDGMVEIGALTADQAEREKARMLRFVPPAQ